jgi:hypothetical protein
MSPQSMLQQNLLSHAKQQAFLESLSDHQLQTLCDLLSLPEHLASRRAMRTQVTLTMLAREDAE